MASDRDSPYVIVGPQGVAYIGLHENEADAWRTYLGWPTRGEVRRLQHLGWYCAPAELHWKMPQISLDVAGNVS